MERSHQLTVWISVAPVTKKKEKKKQLMHRILWIALRHQTSADKIIYFYFIEQKEDRFLGGRS